MEKQTIHVVLLCDENSIFLSRSKQIFLKLLDLLRVFLQINMSQFPNYYVHKNSNQQNVKESTLNLPVNTDTFQVFLPKIVLPHRY